MFNNDSFGRIDHVIHNFKGFNMSTNTASNVAPQANRVSLVQSPAAVAFISQMTTESGVKAHLGDFQKFDVGVQGSIMSANEAMLKGAQKIQALVHDKTRDEPMKHIAGKSVAMNVIAQLDKSRATIERHAELMHSDALSEVSANLRVNSGDSTVDRKIVDWVCDMASKDMMRLQIAAKNDRNVAGAVANLPSVLLGMDDGAKTKLVISLLNNHLPETADKIVQADSLRDLAVKYENSARDTRQLMANWPFADQSLSTRVEV